MELKNDAPADAGTASEKPNTLEESYDAAVRTLTNGTGNDEQPADDAEEDEAPDKEDGTASPEADPEHIKWVKSIDGDTDKETGEIVVDKVAKRAYELNKQMQEQARKISQFEKLLQHPDMISAMARVMNPNAKVESTEPKEPSKDKTEEQAFEEYLRKKFDEYVAPIKSENKTLFENHVKSQIDLTYESLKKEFGDDDDGKPIYDSVKDEVGRQIAQAANQSGITPMDLIKELIHRNALHQTLSATARNILYPRLNDKINSLKNAKLQDKKKVNLTKKGSPSTSVKLADKEINSIFDAAALAELEHPEFKELR